MQPATSANHPVKVNSAPVLASSNYLGTIQLLRFFAALAVVIYHAIIYIGLSSEVSFPEALYEYAWIGAAGVHVFFIISGFIMVLTSKEAFAVEGSMRRFLARRVIRVYPIYWIVALLYLAARSLGVISLEINPATTGFALFLRVIAESW